MSADRCPEAYCMRAPQEWLSQYTIVISEDGFSLFAGDAAAPQIAAEEDVVSLFRIPFGADIFLRNDDSIAHRMASADSDWNGTADFDIAVAPAETVQIRTGFKPGDAGPEGDLWAAPIGIQRAQCPPHTTAGVADKRAEITIFAPGAMDMSGGGSVQGVATLNHPVIAGDSLNLDCENLSGVLVHRLDSHGEILATGSNGADYELTGDLVEILSGSNLITGAGERVEASYSCQNPESGCCRTSLAISGTMRYAAFQRWDLALYPQYLRFRRTTTVDGFTSEGNATDGTYVAGEYVPGGTEIFERNINNALLLTTARDSYTYTGDFCKANSRTEESDIINGGYGSDPAKPCENGSPGGETVRIYGTTADDWVYVSTTERYREEYWSFYVCQTEDNPQGYEVRYYKGRTTEEYLLPYSWDDFKTNFARLFTDPSVYSDSADPWARIQWPYTEYEVQHCIYDEQNARYILNEDGEECDLCQTVDSENQIVSNFDVFDGALCTNQVPGYEFDTGVCTEETRPFDCCGDDLYLNGQPPTRCTDPVLVEEQAGPLWDFVSDPPTPGRVVNDCATSQMNSLPAAAESYVDSPPLHLPALVIFEADAEGRYIQVTRTIVKNFWGAPYKRTVTETREAPTISVDPVVWSCTERLTDAGSQGPCPWIDDLTEASEAIPGTEEIGSTWGNVSDWHLNMAAGEVRMLECVMVCPAYDLVDPTIHTNPCLS